MTSALMRRGGCERKVIKTHTEGRWSFEDRGRNWNDAATNQAMRRFAGNYQKLRQGRILS